MRPRGISTSLLAIVAALCCVLVVTACSAAPLAAPLAAPAAAADQPATNAAAAGGAALEGPVPGTISLSGSRTPRKKRPNIVVIMTDDMRLDDLRFMPAVKRHIRDRGLEFVNSFSPYPLCCPARASFLTGQYSHNHHVLGNGPRYGFKAFDDSQTLATALQSAGYHTGFIGKYLNGYGTADSLVTGRRSTRYVPAGWTDWHGGIENPGYPKHHRLSGSVYTYFDTTFNVNGKLEPNQGRYQTTVLGEKTRRLVSKYSKSRKPFFIYLSALAPHHARPQEPDDPRAVRRDDGKFKSFRTPARPRWVRGWFDHVIDRSPGLPADGGPSEEDMRDKPRYLRRPPEVNDAERQALVEVTRQRAEALYVLDGQIATIIKRLKKTREYDETVLVFTSDNGYYLGEHRVRTGKTKPHEPAFRVPFLIAGRGIPSGEQRFDPITTMDITATIVDLANAGRYMAAPLDGATKMRTINRGDRGWSAPVVIESLLAGMRGNDFRQTGFTDVRNAIGIRTAQYKYIRYTTGEAELYDLDVDPAEMDSVHHDPAYAGVKAAMERLWREYKDCAGSACTTHMAVDLHRGPQELREKTLAQFAIRDALYDR